MLGQRLSKLRGTKTQQEIADKLGISRARYSHYENNRVQPDNDLLDKMASLFDVSIDYLLGRTDDPTPNPKITLRLLRKSIEQDELADKGFFEGNFIMIPIVAEIACGQPIFTDDRIIGEFPADKSLINGGEYVWLRAKGESMIGANILDGSLVLIRLQPEVEAGEIAAVCIDFENATLKRVFYTDNKVTLMPDNPTMKPMTYSSDRIRVVGKAVFVGTKL